MDLNSPILIVHIKYDIGVIEKDNFLRFFWRVLEIKLRGMIR